MIQTFGRPAFLSKFIVCYFWDVFDLIINKMTYCEFELKFSYLFMILRDTQ